MGQFRFASSAALAVLTLTACQDPLLVPNENEPDRGRALATPGDVEALIAGSYATIHNGTLGSNGGLQPKFQVVGLNSYSTLANFEMGPLGAVPRNPVPNFRGNPGESENFRDYQRMHRAARTATIGIAQFQPGFTLGTPGRDARAQAFARFVQGVGLGNLALAYDSASILTEDDPPDEIIPLSAYMPLMTAALGILDDAIAIAQSPAASGSGGFPLPSSWINGNALSAADFVRLARSYKARFRAGVARNPTERAAVDWAQVIADAENGIQDDFEIAMNPATGWDVAWVAQHFTTGAANWHQMWQVLIGMADTSGGYAAYLAAAPANRAPFLVVTPDRRFPQGTTRAAQNAASPGPEAGLPWDSVPYFRNRPSGEDQPGDVIGISMYDFYRSRAFFDATRIGTYPIMTKPEMDLLAAEGYIRTGNFPAATALIDVSRTGKGQLPSVTGIGDLTTPVPGGNACVPRVPAPPNYDSTVCGNLMEALKWEYRMETAFAGYGLWYFAGRGWGDLPEGTANHWPVPFQEMDARRQVFYSLGGVGGPSSAGQGTYGLFTGGVY